MKISVMRLFPSWTVFALLLSSTAVSLGAASPTSKTFHIVKGIDDVHEVMLDGRTCQFTYRAANSAHGESWHMDILREGEEYVCTIEDQMRAPPHATFFGWSAHMYGAKNNQLTSSELWDHEGVLLENDDYLREAFTVRSDTHHRLSSLSKVVVKSN